MVEENPWTRDFGIKNIEITRKLVAKYATIVDYQIGTLTTYTTMATKQKSIVLGTLLIELGDIRSTPLSQFLDIEPFNIYSNIARFIRASYWLSH